MRGKFLLLLICFSLPLLAKKAPKWKPGKFVDAQHEIKFSFKKPGKGDSIQLWDYVTFRICFYNSTTKKFDPSLVPDGSTSIQPNGNSIFQLTEELQDNDLVAALLQLRQGAKVFCVLPDNSPAFMSMGDSSLCYIEVISAQKGVVMQQPANDTVNFVMPDPDVAYFGDSIFTSAKLVEFPMITRCGGMTARTEVFKFQLSWFDNGVQHKDILVYVDCPSEYGKDYFVAGKMYVITAIPLTDKAIQGMLVYDQFPNENLERYFLLRIK